jgi:hypothetical protein
MGQRIERLNIEFFIRQCDRILLFCVATFKKRNANPANSVYLLTAFPLVCKDNTIKVLK